MDKDNFKCKCGSDMFHQGKHHYVIVCANCNTTYLEQYEVKLDYYGSVKVYKKNKPTKEQREPF